jgi:hypothetical protein
MKRIVFLISLLFMGISLAGGRLRRRMQARYFVLAATLLLGLALVCGCGAPDKPEDTLTAGELLANPVYDVEVKVFGQVDLLGELLCPCFELNSGDETLEVWYGLMVEEDGTERPDVPVEGIQNGDYVIVTGELKQAGMYTSLNSFWAIRIEKAD